MRPFLCSFFQTSSLFDWRWQVCSENASSLDCKSFEIKHSWRGVVSGYCLRNIVLYTIAQLSRRHGCQYNVNPGILMWDDTKAGTDGSNLIMRPCPEFQWSSKREHVCLDNVAVFTCSIWIIANNSCPSQGFA